MSGLTPEERVWLDALCWRLLEKRFEELAEDEAPMVMAALQIQTRDDRRRIAELQAQIVCNRAKVDQHDAMVRDALTRLEQFANGGYA